MSQELHVIFGNGPIGSAVARHLLADGHRVRMVSRSGGKPVAPVTHPGNAESAERLEFAAADALDREETIRAARGARAIYHCVNVPYQQWKAVLGQIQANIIDAAIEAGAVLAVTENLYSYERVPEITDATRQNPPTRKGALRRDLHAELVRAGETRGLLWTSLRGSDYYGPGSTMQSVFGTSLFLDPLYAGRPSRMLGRLDMPHSYTYTGDFARALILAAANEEALGRSWIVPNDAPLTAADAASVVFSESGRSGRISTVPRWMIAMMGITSPLLRELREMLYQKEEPYVANGDEFAKRFAFEPTPFARGVRETIQWYESSVREPVAAGR